MAKPARCAKIRPPRAPRKFACPWSSGRFVSTMSILPTLLGKRLSRFSRCSWKIMRPTIATNRVGSHVMVQRSCMALSTVESADTKWWFSTKTAPAISATSLGQQYHVPVCQYIHADPVDAHVVEAFFQAFSPVELGRLGQRQLPHSKPQLSRLATLINSIWSVYAMKPRWPSVSSIELILTTA